MTGALSREATPRGTAPLIVGLTLLGLAVFLGLSILYAELATAWVEELDRSLAEAAWQQAIRFEKAGQPENAKELYQQALEGRFTSSRDRTDALMRLGRLLWWTEGPERALPYLEEAYNQPDHPIWFYEALCDSLIKVGRENTALAVAEHWQLRASKLRDQPQQARARAHGEDTRRPQPGCLSALCPSHALVARRHTPAPR